jgi:activator of HSP90 ATPase
MHESSRLPFQLTRRRVITAAAAVGGVAAAGALSRAAFGGMQSMSSSQSASDDGISRSAEAIHMEPVFHASPARVYDVLTKSAEFDHVVRAGAAMKSLAAQLDKVPTQMSLEPGGPFALFAGYITGRQIDLVPGKRIVQAWRTASWPEGAYSIVSFALAAQGSDTKIVFNHLGFPAGEAEHLAAGWKGNYWEPLARHLASQDPAR